MSDEQSQRRIDTSRPFNDELPSSSPSAKTTIIMFGAFVGIISIVTLVVLIR